MEAWCGDCGVAGTSGIELVSWQMKKLDNKGVGDGRVSEKPLEAGWFAAWLCVKRAAQRFVPLRLLQFASMAREKIDPNRKAQVYDLSVSEAKMEILGKTAFHCSPKEPGVAEDGR